MTETIYEFLYGGLTMKTAGIVLGVALIVTHLFALLKAGAVQEFLKKFPRNRMAGIVLMVIAALFAYVLMREIDMGEFYPIRPKLLIAIPIAAVLIIIYVQEFLAVRALGALLLMMAGPVLSAAFLQPQITRLLLPILAYAWIIKGLYWVGMPYLMRNQIAWVSASAGRWKFACIAGIVYGAALLILAIATY